MDLRHRREKSPAIVRRNRRIFMAAVIIMIICIGTLPLYMMWEARHPLITTLEIKGAPDRIVFIADPHLREDNIDYFNDVISTINEIKPSIVLIGGDFVAGSDVNIEIQEIWSKIDAPVYVVLGNHDYHAGDDVHSAVAKMSELSNSNLTIEGYNVSNLYGPENDYILADELEALLESHGITVLRNEYVTLDIYGKNLTLVGIDDCWAGMSRPPEIPEDDSFRIYLIHEPDCASGWDADIILAGHTHGGQVVIPYIRPFMKENEYTRMSGMLDADGTPLYVTRGIGSTAHLGLEFRFDAPPEIVVINP